MFHALQSKPAPWAIQPSQVIPTHRGLWDGLALAWPFWGQGALFLADVSGNQLHALIPTAMGVSAWFVGERGAELNFGGVSTQFVSVTDPVTNLLDGTSQLSIEILFRPDEVASNFQGLVGKYQPATALRSWRWYLEYDELEFQCSSDGTNFDSCVTTAANLSAGTLYQAVLTYDAGDVVMYLDGVSQSLDKSTLSQTSIYGGGADLVVGQRRTSGGSASDTYDGTIGSVRIWVGKALSAAEVLQLRDYPWRMYDQNWGIPGPAVLHTGAQAAGPWLLAGSVDKGVEELLISGLVNGTEYDLQAFTFDEVGNESSGSTIIQGTPALGEAIPLAVKNPIVQRGARSILGRRARP